MNKLIIAAMVSVALAGCGGGGSDKNTAAQPPAPEMPSGNGGGSSSGDGGAPPAQPAPLSMDCFKSPGSTINFGSSATATFKVSQSINTSGTLSMSCPGSGHNFAQSVLNVNSGNALASQSIPEDCEGHTFNMTLKLNAEDLSATCSWPVNKQLDLDFKP